MSEEDSSCKVCHKADEEEYLVLCDGCDDAYHTFCKYGCTCCSQKMKGGFGKKPPVPEGDWFCKMCAGRPPKTGKKKSSHVFAWGSNELGQLGIPDVKTFIVSPQLVEDLAYLGVSAVSCGYEFTCILTEDGDLYTAGDGNDGKLGHIDVVHESLRTFRKIESLDEKRSQSEGIITRVSCGRDFACAVTTAGHLYSWGSSALGQLGHQDNKDNKKPKKNSALREQEIPVDLIACGDDFVLMTSGEENPDDQFNTNQQGVFMCMGGNQSGQLGDGSWRNQWVPQIINPKGPEITVRPNSLDSAPERFDLGRDIAILAAGRAHSVAVTRTGDVYTWGSGQSGQVGHPKPPTNPNTPSFMTVQIRIQYPRFVKALQDVRITMVSCGSEHTIAIADDGTAFGFGQNDLGQLALDNDMTSVELPTVISALKGITIKSIASGEHHNALLNDKGEVYTWGSGSSGELGNGETKEFVSTPKKLKKLSNVGAIACGGKFTVAVESPCAFKAPVTQSKKGSGAIGVKGKRGAPTKGKGRGKKAKN